MIKLVFVNESCQNSAYLSEIEQNSSISEYLKRPRTSKIKKERMLAYGGLFYLLSHLYNIDYPIINFSGKPTLANNGTRPSFNLSHTDGAVVVAITEDYEQVGVDIERLMPSEVSERIFKRFLFDKEDSLPSNRLGEETEIFTLYSHEGELVLKKVQKTENGKAYPTGESSDSHPSFRDGITKIKRGDGGVYSVTEKYTLLESVLKCEGGGFSSFTNYSEIKRGCECFSFWLRIKDKEYSLSLSCSGKKENNNKN